MTRRFKSGSGQFACESCGKETRDTGHHEGALMLCKKCIYGEYMKNAESEYGIDSDEYLEYKAVWEAC